jgi:aspartyl-tRNA(Asn)/glutamyl-tRNA(Gln) amidotransferase subunit A
MEPNTALPKMTAWQLKYLLTRKEISNRDIMLAVLNEIERKESLIKAYITIRKRSELLKEAESIDNRRLRKQQLGILEGLPVAIKDIISTKGVLTTCASRILANYIPPYDATVVKNIYQEDGIIIGKTNLDEFAMGSSTENSAFQITHNPHDLNYVPGGTSGGSAAAVAADETILSIGSDTGGSVRQPAAFCGVVGLKPTFGRVSRYGLIAYGSSLDTIGVITKDVRDAALLMGVIAGYDEHDATSLRQVVPNYNGDLEIQNKIRIGVPEEYFAEGLSDIVKKNVLTAISLLEKDGNEIVTIKLPHTSYAIATYYIIACASVSANLARYSGVLFGHRAANEKNMVNLFRKSRSEGFGDEVMRRIMLGTYALSTGYYDEYYGKATRVRTLISRDFEDAFRKCDVIVHPITPEPAFKIGEKSTDPMSMYLVDIYSVIANLVGIPAISIPCGWSDNHLPIGLQLATNHLEEHLLLKIAAKLEHLLEKHQVWSRLSLYNE